MKKEALSYRYDRTYLGIIDSALRNSPACRIAGTILDAIIGDVYVAFIAIRESLDTVCPTFWVATRPAGVLDFRRNEALVGDFYGAFVSFTHGTDALGRAIISRFKRFIGLVLSVYKDIAGVCNRDGAICITGIGCHTINRPSFIADTGVVGAALLNKLHCHVRFVIEDDPVIFSRRRQIDDGVFQQGVDCFRICIRSGQVVFAVDRITHFEVLDGIAGIFQIAVACHYRVSGRRRGHRADQDQGRQSGADQKPAPIDRATKTFKHRPSLAPADLLARFLGNAMDTANASHDCPPRAIVFQV